MDFTQVIRVKIPLLESTLQHYICSLHCSHITIQRYTYSQALKKRIQYETDQQHRINLYTGSCNVGFLSATLPMMREISLSSTDVFLGHKFTASCR